MCVHLADAQRTSPRPGRPVSVCASVLKTSCFWRWPLAPKLCVTQSCHRSLESMMMSTLAGARARAQTVTELHSASARKVLDACASANFSAAPTHNAPKIRRRSKTTSRVTAGSFESSDDDVNSNPYHITWYECVLCGYLKDEDSEKRTSKPHAMRACDYARVCVLCVIDCFKKNRK